MDPDTLLKGGAALAAGLVLHAMAQPKQPAKNRKGSAYDGKVCASWTRLNPNLNPNLNPENRKAAHTTARSLRPGFCLSASTISPYTIYINSKP
jgi:hypothetical protein